MSFRIPDERIPENEPWRDHEFLWWACHERGLSPLPFSIGPLFQALAAINHSTERLVSGDVIASVSTVLAEFGTLKEEPIQNEIDADHPLWENDLNLIHTIDVFLFDIHPALGFMAG